MLRKKTPQQERVERFFCNLARFYTIPIDHKWKAGLARLIGEKIGAKDANILGTWILRGSLPKHVIQNILLLDISNDLKEESKRCVAQPAAPSVVGGAVPMDSKEIIARLKTLTGLSQKEIAEQIFGISDKNLSNKIKRGTLDFFRLIRWAAHEKVDLNLLLVGSGSVEAETVPRRVVAGAVAGYEQTPENDLLTMTKEVLRSGTSYAVSLTANILSFYEAVQTKKNLEARLDMLEKKAKVADKVDGLKAEPPNPSFAEGSGGVRTT